MAKRQRDYAAEYRARQARSQARYGVTYNEQRRLVEQGRAAGLGADSIRSQLGRLRAVIDAPGAALRDVLRQQAARREAYRTGAPVPSLDLPRIFTRDRGAGPGTGGIGGGGGGGGGSGPDIDFPGDIDYDDISDMELLGDWDLEVFEIDWPEEFTYYH